MVDVGVDPEADQVDEERDHRPEDVGDHGPRKEAAGGDRGIDDIGREYRQHQRAKVLDCLDEHGQREAERMQSDQPDEGRERLALCIDVRILIECVQLVAEVGVLGHVEKHAISIDPPAVAIIDMFRMLIEETLPDFSFNSRGFISVGRRGQHVRLARCAYFNAVTGKAPDGHRNIPIARGDEVRQQFFTQQCADHWAIFDGLLQKRYRAGNL